MGKRKIDVRLLGIVLLLWAIGHLLDAPNKLNLVASGSLAVKFVMGLALCLQIGDVFAGVGILLLKAWARVLAIAIGILDIAGMGLVIVWTNLFRTDLVAGSLLSALLVLTLRGSLIIFLRSSTALAQFQRKA